MSNTNISFQVLKNLVYAADITAAALVSRVSKEGRAYTQWQAPLKIGPVQVGTLTAFDQAPQPKLKTDGTYGLVKKLVWSYKVPKFISIKEEELVAQGYTKFYEDDQTSSKSGLTHHIKGYHKAVDGTYIKVWVYTDLGDKGAAGAVRAQVEMTATTYSEVQM